MNKELGWCWLWLTLAVITTVAGCGGGGGSDPVSPVADKEPQPAALVSGATEATHNSPVTAFNQEGDGLALWIESSGTGERLVLAAYSSSAGGWLPETELGLDRSHQGLVRGDIASDGTGFMVIWTEGDYLFARPCTIAPVGIQWGTAEQVEAGVTAPRSPQVASNGSGYAASWWEGSVYGAVFADNGSGTGTWGSAVPLGTTSSAGPKSIASNGGGYGVTWILSGMVYVSLYENGAWGAAEPIDAGGGGSMSPEIASDGSGYAVAWTNFDGSVVNVWAGVYADAGGSFSWSGPALIEALPGSANRAQIASDGTGYAVSWQHSDSSTGDQSIYLNLFLDSGTGPAWQGPVEVDAGGTSAMNGGLAAGAGAYRVGWAQIDSAAGLYACYLRTVTPGAGGSVDWGTATIVSDGTAWTWSPTLAAVGNGTAVVWPQEKANATNTIYANFVLAGVPEEPVSLVGGNYRGGATEPHLARNAAGEMLAVWLQYEGGVPYVYGSYFDGAWIAAQRISFTSAESGKVAVASNGTDFMVIWGQSYRCLARRAYRDNSGSVTWGAQEVISTGTGSLRSLDLSSDGTGYLAAWSQTAGSETNIYAASYVPAGGTGDFAWEAPVLLDSGTGSAEKPRLASDGAGYAVAWQQWDSSGLAPSIYLNRYRKDASGAWTWTGAEEVDGDSTRAELPDIASNASGYAVTWLQPRDAGYVQARVLVDNGADPPAWGLVTRIDSGSNQAIRPHIASNGTGYAAVWKVASSTNPGSWEAETAVYEEDGSGTFSWGMPEDIDALAGAGTDGDDHRIASDGSGYAAVWVRNDGAEERVYLSRRAVSGWGAAEPVDAGRGVLAPEIDGHPGGYALGWAEFSETDAIAGEIWVKRNL